MVGKKKKMMMKKKDVCSKESLNVRIRKIYKKIKRMYKKTTEKNIKNYRLEKCFHLKSQS